MAKYSLIEITKTDSLALTSFIDNWKNNDKPTVLLAYAELKRRNYSLNDKSTKLLNEFCEKQNGEDIDTLLSKALIDIGYNSYDECYEKEITSKIKVESANITKI